MEGKKSENKRVVTILLIIAVIIIITMGYFMYKMNNENNEAKTKIENLNSEVSNLKSTITNLQETINNNSKNNNSIETNTTHTTVEDNSNTSNTDKTGESTPPQTPKQENNKDIIGTWKTYQVHDVQSSETIVDLTKIFGTSYISYGSYLKLNEDGTFLDAIYPVTSGEESIEGTYQIEKNYYKEGDCYVFLNYSDGRTKTFMIIYYEENEPVLSCFEPGDTYQFDLKK